MSNLLHLFLRCIQSFIENTNHKLSRLVIRDQVFWLTAVLYFLLFSGSLPTGTFFLIYYLLTVFIFPLIVVTSSTSYSLHFEIAPKCYTNVKCQSYYNSYFSNAVLWVGMCVQCSWVHKYGEQSPAGTTNWTKISITPSYPESHILGRQDPDTSN
jgi:hypothetical protein